MQQRQAGDSATAGKQRFGGENAVNHYDFPGQDQQERAGDPACVHPARPDYRQGDRSCPEAHQQIAGEASPFERSATLQGGLERGESRFEIAWIQRRHQGRPL